PYLLLSLPQPPPNSTLFPYTTLFRSKSTLLLQALAQMSAAHKSIYVTGEESAEQMALRATRLQLDSGKLELLAEIQLERILGTRSEEHTSELQSLRHLVCRLLLEKKK